jgi:signal transduction histidine kinase
MSKNVDREPGSTLALRCFIEALSHARTPEEVFTFGLNAVHDIYRPDRAFVVMSDSDSDKDSHVLMKTSPVSSASIPVYFDKRLLGKFVLHFKSPRLFTEEETMVAEIIGLQVGLILGAYQEQRVKAELAAMTVHELRSPLMVIKGAAALIKAGKEVAVALEMIQRNVRLQESLINELLEVSKTESGKLAIQIERVDLAPLLKEVVDEVELTAAETETSIRIDIPDSLIVRGDGQRLRQVFSNLLRNSVRCASPQGEVRVRLHMQDGSVETDISDNGIGIETEHLQHIFERFRQAPSERTGYNGTGLGLAIVQDLVTMQGGTVSVASEGPGKGAAFRVRLQPA